MNGHKNIILIFLLLLQAACEEIYDPKLEKRGNVIVADARINIGVGESIIKIRQSTDFQNKDSGFPAVKGAEVFLIDNINNEYVLPEINTGDFIVDVALDPESQYKIRIKYNNDIYESGFESVPEIPEIDSLYGSPEKKVLDEGGVNSVDDFRERDIVQCYLDINPSQNVKDYRFTWRKITQYSYVEVVGEIDILHFVWFSRYPTETFNIASPPLYKAINSIAKHPVFYIDTNAKMPDMPGAFNLGYIFILYQYTLSESAAKYYKDLNNQLSDDGQIFDPMYVQARNNLKCVNNPEKIILGNFEISAVKETRYYIKNLSRDLGFILKEIPYFYDIPMEGDVIESPPDFWESKTKIYP